jgi:hypothetical protein
MSIRIEKNWYFFGKPMVIYLCPCCEGELKSPIEDIGKEDTCPECNAAFEVPGTVEYQAYLDARIKKKTEVNAKEKFVDLGCNNEPDESKPTGFYKPIKLSTVPFNYEKEVDERIYYYNKFKYFAPILNQNPNVVLGVSIKECPYCEELLTKKECLNCGKPYRSRSSVLDYTIWVNIREEWAQPIDEQRAIRDGWHQGYLEAIRLRESIKDVLVAKGQNDNLEKNVEYFALEREKDKYAKNWFWGFYVSAVYQQAVILRDMGKTMEALEKFIEQVYLDLNGPNNFPSFEIEPTPQELRVMKKEFKLWEKEFSSMTHAFEIESHATALGLHKEELKDLFIKIATYTKDRVKCPLKPITAFNKVWKEIKEDYMSLGE